MGKINIGDTVVVNAITHANKLDGYYKGQSLVVRGIHKEGEVMYFEGNNRGLLREQLTVMAGDAIMETYRHIELDEETLTHGEMKEEIGMEESDAVNQPNHYASGKYEVIDYIKDKLTSDQYEGYCMGNVIKYVSRYQLKNGTEDLEKAKVYLSWAIEERESRNA